MHWTNWILTNNCCCCCFFYQNIRQSWFAHLWVQWKCVCLCVTCCCHWTIGLFQPLPQQPLWLELWQKFSHSPPALKWHLPVCHPCFRWVWKTGEVTHSHSHLYSPSLLCSFLYGHVWRSCQGRVNMGLRSLRISPQWCVVFVRSQSFLASLMHQDLCVWLWCQII